MKLEVGKYYEASDGRMVGPLRAYGSDCFDWHDDGSRGGSNWLWEPNGRGVGNVDLISEWTHPTTGTLAELDVKAGDVVVSARSGLRYEVKVMNNGRLSLWNINCERWGVNVEDSTDPYHLVSRAPDAQPTGPVITETVTRKRIVPGVYAGFWIGPSYDGDDKITIGMSNSKDDTMHTFDRADLIAARDILSQLIDAMEDV